MTSIADIWLILKTLRNLNIKKLKNLRNANSGKYHTLLMHFFVNINYFKNVSSIKI